MFYEKAHPFGADKFTCAVSWAVAIAAAVVSLAWCCVTFPGAAFARSADEAAQGELVGTAAQDGQGTQLDTLSVSEAPLSDDANANAVDPSVVTSIPIDELPSLDLSTEARRAKRPTDIVFVVDTTGSMHSYIYNVKSNLISFVRRLKSLGVNPRMALVEYRDVFADGYGSTKLYRFGGSRGYWTKSADAMIRSLNGLGVGGGGDIPETPTQAIGKFLNNTKFKKGSDRFVFLLTDANYKTRSGSKRVASMSKCVSKLKKRGVHAIVVSRDTYRSTYHSLFHKTRGRFVDISSSSYYDMLSSTADWISDRVLESYQIPKAKTKVGKCYYTGNSVKPRIVVRCSGKKLKYGRDYVIVYSNNRKVGRASATIYARGNYVGSKNITFKIQRANIAKVKVRTDSMTYSGGRCRPVPSRIYYKGHYLYRGTDYKIVKYGNNVNAGKRAYYVIKGLGNFRGTKRVYFTIHKAPLSWASTSVKAVTYSGKAKKPRPTLTFGGKTLKLGKDYRIVGYTNNVNAGKHAYVKVKGRGNFKGTVKVRFTIKRAKLSRANAKVKAVTYTGKRLKPKVKLTFNGMKLKRGRDYSIVGYENNVNAGKHAVVKVKGMGNFKSSKKIEFTIKRASVKRVDASVKSLTFTGSALTPKLASATFKGKKLKAGRDYRIVGYKNNVNAGKKACVIIQGRGNFKGKKSVRFTIKKAKLRRASVAMKAVSYTGAELHPKVASATFKGKKLKVGRDFRIVGYDNNVNAGKRATATLEGRGNFKGTKVVRFTLQKVRLKGADVTVKSTSYNGKARQPKVRSVVLNGAKLKAGRDYKVVGYSNNVNAGKSAIVKVKGLGNYWGTARGVFTIRKAKFKKVRISVSSMRYTGTNVVPKVKAKRFGMKLVAGKDYKLRLKDNVNAGTATAILVGKGNFRGKQVHEFPIARASISKAKVVVAKQKYTGKVVKPNPTSILYKGRTLKAGKDYKIVRYANNVKAGSKTASMVVRGLGNFKGKKTVRFTIEAVSKKAGKREGGSLAAAGAFAVI